MNYHEAMATIEVKEEPLSVWIASYMAERQLLIGEILNLRERIIELQEELADKHKEYLTKLATHGIHKIPTS
jgi:hypothetical protein